MDTLQFWKLSEPALHLVPGTTLDDAGPTFDDEGTSSDPINDSGTSGDPLNESGTSQQPIALIDSGTSGDAFIDLGTSSDKFNDSGTSARSGDILAVAGMSSAV
jgi:hypothetical protein